MTKSELIKAYKHKGINYKLIVITWPDGECLAYLTKRLDNGVLVARLSIFKGKRSWLVLPCFYQNIANEIKKYW